MKDRQAEDSTTFSAEHAAYREEVNAHKSSVRDWNKKPHGDRPEAPEQPTRRRCVVQDSTIEALAPILMQNSRGVLLARDELSGWIGSFDKYSSGRGSSDVQKWLEIYNGESIVIDRKTGDTPFLFVKRPSVSICGGIQPDVLSQCLTDEHKSNGLQSRLLMAYPPRQAK
ncbi:MAG: DUF3987 domain-containing protein, partial [Fuerstiella sp.]